MGYSNYDKVKEKLKASLLAAGMSVMKADELILNSFDKDVGDDLKKEEKKFQLNLISAERFHAILERADRYKFNPSTGELEEKNYDLTKYGKDVMYVLSNKEIMINESRVTYMGEKPIFKYYAICERNHESNNKFENNCHSIYIKKNNNSRLIEFVLDEKYVRNLNPSDLSISSLYYEYQNKYWAYDRMSYVGRSERGEDVILQYIGDVINEEETTLKFDNNGDLLT